MTRGLRLLKRALAKTKLSPEDFAARHSRAVAHYSARTVRRWLAGAPIPAHAQGELAEFAALNALLPARKP